MEKQEPANSIQPISDSLMLKKANLLIDGFNDGTLLCQKIFTLGLLNLTKENGVLISKIHGVDLQKLLHTSAGALYPAIKKLCIKSGKGEVYHFSILDWTFVYQDDEEQHLEVHTIITDAKFQNGVLSLYFNRNIESRLTELKDNYTLLPYKEMMGLKYVSSFRLLEILKCDYSLHRYRTHCPAEEHVIFTHSVVKLKFELGIIPCRDEQIRIELSKEYPNYRFIEERVELLGINRYTGHNFMSCVINKSVNDINTKCASIRVKAVPVREGHRITEIRFEVWTPEEKAVQKKTTSPKQPDNKPSEDNTATLDTQGAIIFSEVFKSLKTDFTPSQTMEIINWAGADKEKIDAAYKAIKTNGQSIQNKMGFMRKAIQNGYEVEGMKKATRVRDYGFKQREYSDEEYERIEERMRNRT